MTASPSVLPLQLGGGGYQISRSVRLRSSASAYFNRTAGTPTNNQKFTWSGWVKIGTFSTGRDLFGAATGVSNYTDFYLSSGNNLVYVDYAAGFRAQLISTQVFRDPSAWYHLVLVVDVTNATAANRTIMYVNGVQITSFSTNTTYTASVNPYINQSTVVQGLGLLTGAGSSSYWDGYLAEVNFIDGQALTASSFGYTDSNGIWQPKAYTGTYGTNGFYLKFTDNSAATAAAIGKDYSGNGNNWTPNNISVTAGVTYDSMIDSPTVGYAASNYCVLNPLKSYGGVQDGNLDQYNALGNWTTSTSSFYVSSGKWYWEETYTNLVAATSYGMTGIVDNSFAQQTAGNYPGLTATSYGYFNSTGNKYNNGTTTAYGATYANNDIIGVALDMDAGTLTFYKNGVSQGVAFTGLSGSFTPALSTYGSVGYINFGQRPFSYTPPTGFKALNTYNLPAATINNGATVMAASTYTANGGVQTVLNSANNAASVSFQPDLFWIKPRSAVGSNILANTIVGVSKYVYSDQAVSEVTNANYITSANSNGFSLGSANYAAGTTMVGWQWQAGQGTTSSNTNGSITSTVSVNQSAGFSIVTYTGTLSGTPGTMPTVGHGLGVAPKLVISKSRNVAGVDSGAWFVWSANTGSTDYYLRLNTTAAVASVSGGGGGTMVAPTSTVFSTPYISGANISANNYVAYCWSEVAGYSKFGSYTGNGSADGPFVYCGFRPRWLMIKRTDTTGGWTIWDTSRDPYNIAGNELQANTSAAEAASQSSLDVLSNGIKLRNTYPAENASGGTYIFAAFAENPLNISRAR